MQIWLLEAMGSQEPARQLVLGVDSEEELVADSVDSEQRQQIVVAVAVGSSSCNAAAVVESFSSCLHPDLLQRQMMCLDIGNCPDGHAQVFENIRPCVVSSRRSLNLRSHRHGKRLHGCHQCNFLI